MTALVPDQLFRLLELVALLTLTVGGIAIVALLLSGLFWLREWWEARREPANSTTGVGEADRVSPAAGRDPTELWPSGHRLSAVGGDQRTSLAHLLDPTAQPWLDSEPFTGPLDYPQGQPHPYDYKPREPMVWGRS